jgi:hypothetical protein
MATVRFQYVCSGCGHTHIEQRDELDAQIFTTCVVCDKSSYSLLSKDYIGDDHLAALAKAKDEAEKAYRANAEETLLAEAERLAEQAQRIIDELRPKTPSGKIPKISSAKDL